MQVYLLTRWLLLLIIICVLFFPLQSYSSPESKALIELGAKYLSQQKYNEALEQFESAAQADSDDGQAIFFEGVALNRLDRFREALLRLEEAATMGSDHPELEFEMGWSLLRADRFQSAVERLEGYEKTHPGGGQTSEFLGRAYFGLGEYDRAVEKLQEAMERDPNLRPTVLFTLAMVEQARQDTAAAREHFDALITAAEIDDPLTLLLQPYFARITPSKAAKPWQVNLSASGGYNDNVVGVSSRALLPADISDQASPFARFTLNSRYAWQLTPKNNLATGYAFLANVYSDIPSFDLLDHFFYVTASHRVNAKLSGNVQISDRFSRLGGENFRNQFGLRPAIQYRFTDWTVSELSYFFAGSDYYFDTLPELDRTGVTHTFGFTQYVTVPRTDVSIYAGYFHIRNRTDGSDFDSRINGLHVGLNTPLIWGISGDAFYSRTYDRYDNPSIFTNFAFRRKDTTDSATIQLARPILGGLELFARYEVFDLSSNIQNLSFTQQAWSGGLLVSF